MGDGSKKRRWSRKEERSEEVEREVGREVERVGVVEGVRVGRMKLEDGVEDGGEMTVADRGRYSPSWSKN
jgi:hypothetical protein